MAMTTGLTATGLTATGLTATGLTATGLTATGPAGAALVGPTPGPLMFARYAYPPNALGFCGPDDSRALLEYAAAGVLDLGLTRLAQGFAGAWPYLELIAASTGIRDPLDRRVVEAYWVGNDLLGRVRLGDTASSLDERFRRRIGREITQVIDPVLAGAVPHHSFHVLCVYPWVGLLGEDRKGRHALDVLDRCRIRWGRVTAIDGDSAVVRCRPLEFDGRLLRFGAAVLQRATLSVDGLATSAPLRPGDWVALHWDWICDRLSRRQLSHLRRVTERHVALVNAERAGRWAGRVWA
jgi:hypothetical protein